MRKRTIDNYIKKMHRNNSGFTLIELIVVLILMGILLGTTLYAGLGWQDWAQFKHEEACAEEIFYAAQNQLTELDSSNALYSKIARPMMKSDDITEGYKAGYQLEESLFNTIVYEKNNNSDVTYDLKTIWKNSNRDKDPGHLVRLKVNANEYSQYLGGTLPDDRREEATLLFNMVAPYISDKGVLNGAIIIEFSPDAGQVFSVCYSDRANSLEYISKESVSSGQISVMNRVLQERESVMLGYFSVDSLYKKVRGRGTLELNLRLRIENDNVFSFVVEDDNGEIGENDQLSFKVYDGDTDSEKMTIQLNNSEIKTATSIKQGIETASQNPVTASVTFPKGSSKYSGTTDDVSKNYRIPAFKIKEDGKPRIYIILDAADVQAQTLSYSKSKYFDGKEGFTYDEANDNFVNTFSFYRFGLSNDVNYIYADLTVVKCDENNNPINSSKTPTFSYSGSDPTKLHKAQSAPKGECTTFASHKEDGDQNVYEIANMRHFYNMRYETDYKAVEDKKDTFKLVADISWKTFVGKDETTDPNFFLDSAATDNSVVSGINYKTSTETPKILGDTLATTTADYPFPGFRKLDKNDTFTQDAAYGEQGTFTISDLNITLIGNIIYGVYGNDVKETSEDGNYSELLGEHTSGDLGKDPTSKRNFKARAGEMPLGLFAENLGNISNITLNRHVVSGIQEANNRVVYTCMVGGFAGNNIGKISKLTLLNNESNTADSTIAKISKINGRTDVGGIIGRQSFVLKDVSSRNVTLAGLTNYAEVTGLENVGGIVGIAYTRYVDGSEATEDEKEFDDIYCKYGTASVSDYTDIKGLYFSFHDGYTISDTYTSMTGEKVSRNLKITIENCKNRGVVSGDALARKYIVGKESIWKTTDMTNYNGSSKAISCAFIGGIAGCTMDGIMTEKNSLQARNSSGTLTTLYSSILDDYVKNGDSYIVVKNCDSYTDYTKFFDIKESTLSSLGDETAFPALKYDYYVGGLIGYSKLTSIENCNNKPTDITTIYGVPQTYVLGKRFVGGLIGCGDMTRFDNSDAPVSEDGYAGKSYGATNYNNVIGRLFVGGISGGFGAGAQGIGDNDGNFWALQFRTPSVNPAKNITSINGELIGDSSINESNRNTPVVVKDILNTGAVLCLKNTYTNITKTTLEEIGGNVDSYSGYSGYCGGITGVSAMRFSNADNIQSDEVKDFILKLYHGSGEGAPTVSSINNLEDSQKADTVINLIESSSNKFGGFRVGGLAGYISKSVKVNYNKDSASHVDALVCGQRFVGGMIADEGEGNYPLVMNFYPYRKSSQNGIISSGLNVYGLDFVGGVFGDQRIDILLKNEEAITDPYTVIGRYAVGGFVGEYDKPTQKTNGKLDVSIDLDESTINVYGKGYVGGVIGYSASETVEIAAQNTISFNNINVYGDYFVGGFAGALSNAYHNNSHMSQVERFNLNDINVTATCFGGGLAGLYAINDKNDYHELWDPEGKPYSLVRDLCSYSTSDSQKISDTHTNVVKADISQNTVFDKTTNANAIEIKYNAYGDGKTSNNVNVSAKLFAGGLFGYVPDGTNLTVKGFVNGGNIEATGSVSSFESEDSNATYSYLGGVVGRVPRGMKLINCANNISGDTETRYYRSQGTYLGGLTEVNAGVITGDIAVDEAGIVQINSYLVNKTHFSYEDKNVGAFAGVNGTAVEGCEGIIQYVQNRGNIYSSNGTASGIAAAQQNDSMIQNSINLADIKSDASTASGVVASPSGTDKVQLCRNYGAVNGASKYGIAGGKVGTITKNLEAGGLNETPIATSDNTMTRNFYIFGNVEDDQGGGEDVGSGTWDRIDFSAYTNNTFSNGNKYVDIFIWTFGQNVNEIMYPTIVNYQTQNYTNYNQFANQLIDTLGSFDNFKKYLSYAYAAARSLRAVNSGNSQNTFDNFMQFCMQMKEENRIPVAGVTTNYVTSGNSIDSSSDNNITYTYNDNLIAGADYTQVYPENGDKSYYTIYKDGWSDYTLNGVTYHTALIYDVRNVYLNNSYNFVVNDPSKLQKAYTNYFKDTNAMDDYMAKLYAYYCVNNNNNKILDDSHLVEFINFVIDRANDSYKEIIEGNENTYTPEWPINLRVNNNSTLLDLQFKSTNGYIGAGISGLNTNPISFPASVTSRMDTYTTNDQNGKLGTNINVNSLDSKFINMVNNEQEYANTYFVPEN